MQEKSSDSVVIISANPKMMIIQKTKELYLEISKRFSLHFLAIFGSYHNNSFSYSSDADILIVFDEDTPITFEQTLSYALGISDEIDWQIHIYSLVDFVNALNLGNKFLERILKNNTIIYCSNRFKMIKKRIE